MMTEARRSFTAYAAAAAAGACVSWLVLCTDPARAQQNPQEGAFPVELGQTPGEPYDLHGNRMVFVSWYYIQPGDLDYRDREGKSVYVKGNCDPWEATYIPVDMPTGIRLMAQRPQRVGPVLERERPWEAMGVDFGTVLKDGDTYRAWGGSKDANGNGHGCYFESKDGMTWERPNLGLVEFEGSRDNNLLDSGPGTVFVDPSAPEDERYKGVVAQDITLEQFEAYRQRRPNDWEPRAVYLTGEGGNVQCIKAAVSADGIHWRDIPDPLVVEGSDTQVVAYYDAQLKKYVMYTRVWSAGPRTSKLPHDIRRSWTHIGRRAIGRSESADFRNFPVSQMILEPSPDMAPADVLYSNAKTTVPGAPDQHLLFPSIWHVDEDTTSITMASSHDTVVWHYLPGTPFFDTPPFGEWDGGCVFVRPNLIELANGDFALPYTGYIFPHKYPRGQLTYQPGYLVWPKGRLVALEAPEGGEFATIPFMLPGRKLRINCVTERAGSIRVQVDGADGRSFADCDPIIGDCYRKPVTWKGQDDIGRDPDTPVILRVRMDKAKLYAFEFE